MKPPSILVMETDSLLKRALLGIMQDEVADLSISISQAVDVTSLIADITSLHPDVVMFGESMALSATDILNKITAAHPDLRLIVVSEQSNWLHIFRSEDRLITSLPDFLQAIHAK